MSGAKALATSLENVYNKFLRGGMLNSPLRMCPGGTSTASARKNAMKECRKRFWDTFEQMQEDFDRFFEHYAQSKRTAFLSYGTRWSPACNIYDTGDCISILVEIAGMEPQRPRTPH